MRDVTTIAELQQRRREAAKLGDFGEPVDAGWIVVAIERTSDGERRVAIMAPERGHAGHSLSPDQAEQVAQDLLREAAAARARVPVEGG